MRAVNFCYWLQGWIEIENPEGKVDEKKTNVIKAHLNLAWKYENLDKIQLSKMSEIQGFIYDLREELKMREVITNFTLSAIKQRLNSLFEHEIDPVTYTAEQDEEMSILHGGRYLYDDPNVKC